MDMEPNEKPLEQSIREVKNHSVDADIAVPYCVPTNLSNEDKNEHRLSYSIDLMSQCPAD